MVRHPFLGIFGGCKDSRLPKGVEYYVETIWRTAGDGSGGWTAHEIYEIEDGSTNVIDINTGIKKTFTWDWKGNRPSHVYSRVWSLIHYGAASKEEYDNEVFFRINEIKKWKELLPSQCSTTPQRYFKTPRAGRLSG